jgi:hypothetical protein
VHVGSEDQRELTDRATAWRTETLLIPIPNKIRRLLDKRPAKQDLQAQLFWLVDVIFACGEASMLHEAAHLRRALGHLGKYLEEHQDDELARAMSELDEFERLLAERRKSEHPR